MPKGFILEGYRVTVETRTMGRYGPNTGAQRDANEIAEKIGKYVGIDFDEAKSPDVEEFGVHACTHCGDKWTEEDDDYNGGCCTADQASEEERQAEAARIEAEKNKPSMPQHVLTERDGRDAG